MEALCLLPTSHREGRPVRRAHPAAVPAAALGYLLVATFLTRLGQLSTSTTLMGLYGVTLAFCALMVFMPFAIVIFGRRSPATAKAGQEAPSEAAAPADEKPAGELGEGELEEAEPVEEFEHSEPELDAVAGEGVREAPTFSGEIEIVEPSPSEEFEAFDADEIVDEKEADTDALATESIEFGDEEEPPAPPKKKKR